MLYIFPSKEWTDEWWEELFMFYLHVQLADIVVGNGDVHKPLDVLWRLLQETEEAIEILKHPLS